MVTDLSIEIPVAQGQETVLIEPGYVTLSPGLYRILPPEALTDLVMFANIVADDLDNLANSLDQIETMKTAFMQARADQFVRTIKARKAYGPKTKNLRQFLIDPTLHAAFLTARIIGDPYLGEEEGEAGG